MGERKAAVPGTCLARRPSACGSPGESQHGRAGERPGGRANDRRLVADRPESPCRRSAQRVIHRD